MDGRTDRWTDGRGSSKVEEEEKERQKAAARKEEKRKKRVSQSFWVRQGGAGFGFGGLSLNSNELCCVPCGVAGGAVSCGGTGKGEGVACRAVLRRKSDVM